MSNEKQQQNSIWKKTNMGLSKCMVMLTATFLLIGAANVSAEEKTADEWKYDFSIYLWGSSIKGTTVTGDPISMTFGDLIENLEFAAMTTVGARKNKFSMIADVIYLNVGTGQRHDGEFLGHPVTGNVDLDLKGWVLNFLGGYNLADTEKHQFDIAAGARYLDLTTTATFTRSGTDGRRRFQAGDHLWDGVVGFKGRRNFSDGHYLNYYADVGGGDSKMTWQAMANLAYDYKKFTGIVGYRYMSWNFKNDAPALDNLKLHGPFLAAKWSF